jgi:hypothetical protein
MGDLVRRLGSDFPIERLRLIAAGRDRYYKKKLIPKRDGDTRELRTSTGELKAVQARIYSHLLKKLYYHPSLHGGVVGRSVITNAEPHLCHEVVVKLDIHHFFPSVNEMRVLSIWKRRLDCGEKVAKLLTRLTTFEDQLPQGTSTSPALANLALFDAEGELRKQLAFHGVTMEQTRYVDDIAFSGPSGDEQKLIATVIGVMTAYGFKMKRGKIEVQRAGRPQQICGINVSSDHLSISKDYVSKLRAAVFQLEHATPDEQRSQVTSLEGKARRAHQFRPTLGGKLLERILTVKNDLGM